MWFWWDRVAFAVARSAQRRCTLELSDRTLSVEWRDDATRAGAVEEVVEALKLVGDEDRVAALARLPALLEVDVPASVPREFAPLRWDDARRLETLGVRFGPHSVTHPILSRTSDAQSEAEVRGSWQRLRDELSRPAGVFCYPNGRLIDFGAREIETVRRAGMDAAVTTEPEYAAPADVDGSSPERRYMLPRFPWPETPEQLVQITAGIERAKRMLLRRS